MYHGTIPPQCRHSRCEAIQVQMNLFSPAGSSARIVMKIHAFTSTLPSFPSPLSLLAPQAHPLLCGAGQPIPPASLSAPARSRTGSVASGTYQERHRRVAHCLSRSGSFLEQPMRAGRDRWIRTTVSRSQIPVPYRLAISPCRRGILPLPGKRSAVPPDDA